MSLLGPPFQGWGSHPRLPWPPAPRRLYLLVTCGWHPAPAPLRRPAQPSCGPPPCPAAAAAPSPVPHTGPLQPAPRLSNSDRPCPSRAALGLRRASVSAPTPSRPPPASGQAGHCLSLALGSGQGSRFQTRLLERACTCAPGEGAAHAAMLGRTHPRRGGAWPSLGPPGDLAPLEAQWVGAGVPAPSPQLSVRVQPSPDGQPPPCARRESRTPGLSGFRGAQQVGHQGASSTSRVAF